MGRTNTGAEPAQTPDFKGFSPSRNFHATGNPPRALSQSDHKAGEPMHVDVIMIQPLIALLFGILILILPRLLNYLIAIYLIFIGLVGLFPHLFTATYGADIRSDRHEHAHTNRKPALRKCRSITRTDKPPETKEEKIDAQMADSFPASDPPSFSGGNHIIGAPTGRESEAPVAG